MDKKPPLHEVILEELKEVILRWQECPSMNSVIVELYLLLRILSKGDIPEKAREEVLRRLREFHQVFSNARRTGETVVDERPALEEMTGRTIRLLETAPHQ